MLSSRIIRLNLAVLLKGLSLFKNLYPITGLGFAAGVVAVDYTQVVDLRCAQLQGFAEFVKGGGIGGLNIVNALGFLPFDLAP